MKIKVLSRSTAAHAVPGSAAAREPRNLDPALHPFARAREYTRALNATKLERLFAAPFVGPLGRGHVDGVYALATDPAALDRAATASGDGVVKAWDLPARAEAWQARAHAGLVKGLCWTRDARLLSCAADKTVKLWDPSLTAAGSAAAAAAPLATWLGTAPFTSVSPHRAQPHFAAAAGAAVAVYDLARPSGAPAQTLRWPTAVDSIPAVAFNPVETSLLGSTGTDRSVVLYDLRTASPLARATLSMAANALAWNPMEAFNFAVASEDHNVYLFDMRRVDRALNVLKDHVAAVLDVRFSPTGEELVTASYDRTVRLWERAGGHSRDVYHTARMQRVFAAAFTPDARYVLSGSDDGNVRLWRARAAQRAGVQSARQAQALQYDAALVERYQHMPEIRRIKRHRRLPKAVKKAGEIKAEELKAIKRRQENVRRHSKKGTVPRRSEREKMVLQTEQ